MSILIKNGRIITADADYVADIFVKGESIHTIGKNLSIKADKEIDALKLKRIGNKIVDKMNEDNL